MMNHTYHIGDTVTLSHSRTTGAGRVAAADTLFGQTYLEVYFPATGQVVRRPADDFEPWGDLFDRLSAGQVAPASAFLARLIARQLQALMTHQGVLSAANFRITPLPHQILATELLSLFVGRDDQSHPRMAHWLSELAPERFTQGYAQLEGWDLPALRQRLDELAEAAAHERFLAERVALGEQLAREREKVLSYFEAQEAAVRQIAIDNIRQARLTDLYRRRQEALTALQRRGELVPDLELGMVGVVRFKV